ncbi:MULTISPECIES: ABC transporter ATP-binding protein [unclassified Gemella]|uniref:ABC transporter ATP-binding protein n=1 Tax=unclassified Gemella TaxID=2624949 RepID=UPI001073583B|nr:MULTISPECIES: ABC transporter ATP-binding protein [unclassified Gemella]MBF0710502.1 ABC transporter ATP-binding protein [Gemella sp. GL1.1]MBF0746557.1 ABC transporter ATP-binding protein [Gemella sp. 19428wG2_WT2a]NYS27846.1 ABC transporter ATP-binding protein [Gemella sp. GL1]TFU59917.1 ABC transporter ATP-binding protein [Gemella sp. WT2a]
MNMLEIKNLSYSYHNNPVLDDINIHVSEGEIVSIVGSSGVGKSTLFNIIAGIEKLQTGTIEIKDSQDFLGKVSYMLQKDLLLQHKTIVDNVALPLIIRGTNRKSAREKSLKLLKQFNLDDYADKYPSQLSGGMRQRVALLRTYMLEEKLFLLDEAFSALDAITKNQLHNWYKEVHKDLGLTTLLITHDIEEAITLSHRIYILKNKPGQIVKEIKIVLDPKQDVDIQKLKYKKEILNILEI